MNIIFVLTTFASYIIAWHLQLTKCWLSLLGNFYFFFSTLQITSAVPLIPEKGLKVVKP